jgi:hypothetical protein
VYSPYEHHASQGRKNFGYIFWIRMSRMAIISDRRWETWPMRSGFFQVHRDGDAVRLFTRRGYDWSWYAQP